MNFKLFILALPFLMALAGCVDTTGLSEESSRASHPESKSSSSVTVMEFADLQCPACRTSHMNVVPALLEQYGRDIKYEFMHFPLQSIHRHALSAAQAAECAADQGAFWGYVDLAFDDQINLSRKSLGRWAVALRLDTDLFDRCLKSGIKKGIVLDDFKEGKEIGVTGTPTFFVNGKMVKNDLNSIGSAIRNALEKRSFMPL